MRYVSTRGEAPELSFEDALLAGLARDGGLYVPKTWPQISPETIAGFAGKPFADVAVALLETFTGGAIPRAELIALARDAYARFGHPAVTPLVQIDRSLWVLELFHGPTLAFKDVAMQLLARLMDRVLAARGERVTIVAATSGDTGGAAIEAFRGSSRVDAVVLFPQGRISDVQRRMMTTAAEPNVHAVAIEGTFDDCQALVKAMFNDLPFRDRMRLGAVNSINWGRVVAQVSYYFVAAAALGSPHRPMSFIVPTGNFGDIFAGYAATPHGPADRSGWCLATNENDILYRAWQTGMYSLAEVVAHHLALDGHPGLLQLRTLPVRGLGARCGLRARQDGRPEAEPLDRPGRRHRALPRELHRRACRSGGRRRLHPPREGRERLPARSAQRLRRGCRAQDHDLAVPAHPAHRASPPRTPRSFRTPCRPSPASGPRCRRASPR